MNLLKCEIIRNINEWLKYWNSHNLEGVMDLIHEDIVFENWNGSSVKGKKNLQRSWLPWFINHGDFKFNTEDIFVDEQEQKVLFSWSLRWPSLEKYYKGKQEVRRGVDVLHFKDGKIYKKFTYSKTKIKIEQFQVLLCARESNFFE